MRGLVSLLIWHFGICETIKKEDIAEITANLNGVPQNVTALL